MLAAVARGMGYRSHLKLVDIASRALGRKEGTARLVKASATLKDEEKNDRTGKFYQGVWIDLDTITSILQSLVSAARSWLSENLLADDICKKYYQTCEEVAEIESNLTHCQKLTSGYVFQTDRRLKDLSFTSYLKGAIEQIQEIQKTSLQAHPVFREFYESDLERQFCMANLILARSAHIQVNLTEAAEFLSEIAAALQGKSQVSEYKPVAILYKLEEMLQKFLSGDRAFIEENNGNLQNLAIILILVWMNSKTTSKKAMSSTAAIPDVLILMYICVRQKFLLDRLDLIFVRNSKAEKS
ncbi:hypothetical protein HC766_07605 [Candidatus Gracilibacteria bacterium]|nr:hypothetical protein [Candidatus Gracilibacteria bacterium]